ncbi:MAG: hypothetical protein J0M36_09265 [Caulobacterales bacterium]|mgnify:CR=1 FL=1|nr:hypothetical protein [Caulobacterales bacterium]
MSPFARPLSARRSFVRPALVLALAATALSACATATPYQPMGPGSRYGYAEQRVEGDRYRVTFAGNSVTSREQVEMSLLLRAAELTTQSGYDWFSTANRATQRDSRYSADPFAPSYGGLYPVWSPYWRFYSGGYWSRWDPFWGRDINVQRIDRYEASAEIVMGRGAKPAGDPDAFDAREVIENLRGRVARAM